MIAKGITDCPPATEYLEDPGSLAGIPAEALTFLATFQNALATPDSIESDFGTPGGSRGLRLREGIERFFISDINNAAASAQAQSEVAVMMDFVGSDMSDPQEFNHVPGGCNVLWMDGHVEFVKYKAKWPVTPALARIVGDI